MKLKQGFVLHDVGDEHMAAASGKAAEVFQGLIRNNDTADFIYHALLVDTTPEAIADAMCEQYDAPRETILADVEELIEKLREAGLLDE